MKTLGELKIGDEFYIVHYDGGHIYDIEKHIISIVNETKIGEIIKFFDSRNDLISLSIEREDYGKTNTYAFYCALIASNKETVKLLLEDDMKLFINNVERLNTIIK